MEAVEAAREFVSSTKKQLSFSTPRRDKGQYTEVASNERPTISENAAATAAAPATATASEKTPQAISGAATPLSPEHYAFERRISDQHSKLINTLKYEGDERKNEANKVNSELQMNTLVTLMALFVTLIALIISATTDKQTHEHLALQSVIFTMVAVTVIAAYFWFSYRQSGLKGGSYFVGVLFAGLIGYLIYLLTVVGEAVY